MGNLDGSGFSWRVGPWALPARQLARTPSTVTASRESMAWCTVFVRCLAGRLTQRRSEGGRHGESTLDAPSWSRWRTQYRR